MPDPAAGRIRAPGAAVQIRAAGAVAWRAAQDGAQVALIHRPRYGDWTFPKGKREPGEHVLATAVREVAEETGMRVVLGRPLGPWCYETGGRPKRVDYWAGRCQEAPAVFTPNAEVAELEWLAVSAARERLTYQRDVEMLGEFADGPAETVPLILLRHAEAGHKADWDAEDLARPLDARGAGAAESLAQLLACFGRCRVISSAAERCVATVRPYAALTGGRIELEPAFTTGRKDGDRVAADRAAADRAAAIAADGTPTVICAHRENLPLLMKAVCSRLGSGSPDGRALRKGGFWVLQSAGGTLISAERHHPAAI
jgi:8-oxo-(d)GTP phosphatase